jgi:outer membrane protein assembly factor BamB
MTRYMLMMLALFAIQDHSVAQDWATYRGNSQRTGNLDQIPGPTKPKVLWVAKSQDHFISFPVPGKDTLLLSGLGGFNRPSLHAYPIKPNMSVEPEWSLSSPYLKLPTVSSPVIVGDAIVFGDGMHQTDGAILHCLSAKERLPLWQYPIPGSLVHLEGSPVWNANRLWIGGGSAGVICLETDKAELDGKFLAISEIRQMQQKKWAELKLKFEADKKTNPDFAVPPSEDNLAKAKPKVLWQEGQNKWHVDAPVNLDGDQVFVCSAFLDKEKLGDRAVFSLDATTGSIRWRTALTLNPWGGATIAGDLILVSTSSIGYDPKSLKGAKGEVLAIDKQTGVIKWKKDIPGGVLGCVAVQDQLAVFSCTDGKLRGLNIADGERRILYDAKIPCFAAPTVVKDTAYLGDLRGVIHAVDLKSGTPKWTIDLSTAKVPGMIYGGILLHGGKLYVGTCNLEGPFARQTTAVICLGDS